MIKEENIIEAIKLIDLIDETDEQIKSLQDSKKQAMLKLVELAENKDTVIDGRKLTLVKRKGTVNYSELIKEHLPDIDLDPYRGKESQSWKLS